MNNDEQDVVEVIEEVDVITPPISSPKRMGNLMKSLNSVLDIKDDPTQQNLPAPIQEFNDEYEFTQSKLKEVTEAGVRAIEHLTDIATESGEAKSFQALAQMIKATSDAAAGVMSTAKTKAEISTMGKAKVPEAQSQGTINVQNNNPIVFSGTPKEFKDFIASKEPEIE